MHDIGGDISYLVLPGTLEGVRGKEIVCAKNAIHSLAGRNIRSLRQLRNHEMQMSGLSRRGCFPPSGCNGFIDK
jgi:hypothetical protein